MKSICVFVCPFIYDPALSKILWLYLKCNSNGDSGECGSPLGLGSAFPSAGFFWKATDPPMSQS